MGLLLDTHVLLWLDRDDASLGVDTRASIAEAWDAGRVAVLSGTGWRTADVKAAWHKGGTLAAHTVTFGAHVDQYTLANPTYNTANWRVSDPVTTTVLSQGDGKTRTAALWVQDQWRISSKLRPHCGQRYSIISPI